MQLEKSYNSKVGGSAPVIVDNYIKELEAKRQKYLLVEEETWRQKSRDIWLHQGDQNI